MPNIESLEQLMLLILIILLGLGLVISIVYIVWFVHKKRERLRSSMDLAYETHYERQIAIQRDHSENKRTQANLRHSQNSVTQRYRTIKRETDAVMKEFHIFSQDLFQMFSQIQRASQDNLRRDVANYTSKIDQRVMQLHKFDDQIMRLSHQVNQLTDQYRQKIYDSDIETQRKEIEKIREVLISAKHDLEDLSRRNSGSKLRAFEENVSQYMFELENILRRLKRLEEQGAYDKLQDPFQNELLNVDTVSKSLKVNGQLCIETSGSTELTCVDKHDFGKIKSS